MVAGVRDGDSRRLCRRSLWSAGDLRRLHGATGVPAEKPVVGVFCRFEDFVSAQEPSVHVFRNLDDLAPLMREADLVVSAAGTTLYELCAVGVPTVTVPVVDSLLANVCGFDKRG